jgi:hypothetical protein
MDTSTILRERWLHHSVWSPHSLQLGWTIGMECGRNVLEDITSGPWEKCAASLLCGPLGEPDPDASTYSKLMCNCI